MSITHKQILDLAAEYGTPLYVYDEKGIRETAQQLNSVFADIPGYRNYFAVKATPTPGVIKVLQEEGMGFDCSSLGELEIMRRMGISGNDIFFTSNNTSVDDFKAAIDLNAIITIDDLTQVPVFVKCLEGRPYGTVAVRYNPGPLKEGNFIIGSPLEAKYGMSVEQLIEAINLLKSANIKKFALHTMVASNELEGDYFAETAQVLVDAAKQIEAETGIEFALINLGGGFGIDYSREAQPVDFVKVAGSYKQASDDLRGAQLVTESGRFVTGPHGYLVAKVRYVMHKYKDYIGLDASMQNLMRPGMYGAYHKISILGKEDDVTATYDVVGSLCENNDKFAIDRELPATVSAGDIAVINDVGAHGHAMGFNYNGLLRSAEVLLREDGSSALIRRAETVDDYLDTVIF